MSISTPLAQAHATWAFSGFGFESRNGAWARVTMLTSLGSSPSLLVLVSALLLGFHVSPDMSMDKKKAVTLRLSRGLIYQHRVLDHVVESGLKRRWECIYICERERKKKEGEKKKGFSFPLAMTKYPTDSDPGTRQSHSRHSLV